MECTASVASCSAAPDDHDHEAHCQPTSRPSSPLLTELDQLVRRQKIRIGVSVSAFTVVEIVMSVLAIERLHSGMGGVIGKDESAETSEINYIDNGVVEVVMFAIPFMLVTNVLVLVAIGKDNVWLLLPWMILHCVVIAFMALGAAILTAHNRGILGSLSLLSAILFLLCWKGLRHLFMKMVDRELKQRGDDDDGVEDDDEASMDLRNRHEQIFFGCKDRKFYSHVAKS